MQQKSKRRPQPTTRLMARHDREWAIGMRLQADIPCRRAPLPFPARLVDLSRFAGSVVGLPSWIG